MTIGAAADNDWVLPFDGVSRHHAVASSSGGRLELRDLGSKNGLVQGGRRHAEISLGPGEEVRLGRASLCLEEVALSDPVIPLSTRLDRVRELEQIISSTADIVASGSAGGLHAVLGFVRELSSGGAGTGRVRQRHFERLAAILGARCVALVAATRHNELPLAELAGEVPPDELLAGLRRAFRAGAGRVTLGDATWLVAHHGAGAPAVAALLPAAAADEAWRELTLLVAGGMLASPPSEYAPPPVDETAREEPGDPLRYPPELVLGRSHAFAEILETLRRTVEHGRTFLLLGETGSGKEPIARLIHHSKPAPRGEWVPVSMAALAPELVDAELFGIAKNVATGVEARTGLFEQAKGGTLFLDEIGELPLSTQAKLLRALQEREIRRVGGARVRLDLRIVAATNRDLERMVGEGTFREDLYYRLAQVVVTIPPLRERPADIPALALALAHRFAEAMGKRILGVRAQTLSYLASLPWPGNVRQLEQVMEVAVMSCANGDAIGRQHLPRRLEDDRHREGGAPTAHAAGEAGGGAPTVDHLPDWADQRRELERREVEAALARAGGMFKRAAEILGITPAGLRAKRKRLGLP